MKKESMLSMLALGAMAFGSDMPHGENWTPKSTTGRSGRIYPLTNKQKKARKRSKAAKQARKKQRN